MKSFMNDPENLGSRVGCAFWMATLAGRMAVLFGTIYGMLAGGPR